MWEEGESGTPAGELGAVKESQAGLELEITREGLGRGVVPGPRGVWFYSESSRRRGRVLNRGKHQAAACEYVGCAQCWGSWRCPSATIEQAFEDVSVPVVGGGTCQTRGEDPSLVLEVLPHSVGSPLPPLRSTSTLTFSL